MLTDDAAGSLAEPTEDPTVAADSAPADASEMRDTGGPLRDASGRFTSAASDEAPGATGDAALTDDDPDGLADPTAPGAPVAATPDAAPAPEEPAAAPFVFRAHGKEHPIEGATVAPDGTLRVPAAAVPRVQQLLAFGRDAETVGRERVRELQQQVQQASQRFDAEVAEARATNAVWESLLSQGGEAVLEFLADFERNRPLLQAQIEREVARQQYAAAQALRAPAPEADAAADADGAAAVAESVAALMPAVRQLPDFHGLSDADAQAIQQELLTTYAPLLVRPATAAEAVEYGLQVGQPVFDQDRLVRFARQEAAGRLAPRAAQQAAQHQQRQQAAAQAAKQNATRTAGAAPHPPAKAPPTPGGAVASPAAADAPAISDYASWKRAMGAA